MNNRLINTKVAGGGCTDIVDNYDPFGGGGVALYQLNGNATDVSGNYNGTWGGTAAYTTGVFGQAANFVGGSTYIDTSIDSELQTSVFSYSLWFNASTIDSTPRHFIARYNPTTPAFWGRVENGRIVLYFYSLGTPYNPEFSGINENTWYHLAVTLDGSTAKVYINGTETTPTTFGGSPNVVTRNSTSPILLGQLNGYIGTYPFVGSIDQVRIFNTALDPLEVEALYTEELCICGGTVDTLDILGDGSCIAIYPLDGNANDLSGNYSGTPTNVSYGVGEFDLAGVFNGSTSGINLGNGLVSSLTALSTSAWFNTDNISLNAQILLDLGFSSTGNGLQIFIQSGGNIVYRVNSGGSTVFQEIINGVISNNTWYNITATFENTTSGAYKLYLNNSLIASGNSSQTGSISFASTGLYLGHYNQTFSRFDGSIDQVRIFNKALTPENVQTLYDETACTYVPYYDPITEDATDPFGDGSEYALYEFDNNVIDSEGSYNGLASGNVAYTAGVFGQAINLTGTNASVEIPNFSPSDFSNKNVSVSCWVNMQSLVGTSSKGAHLFVVGSGSWAIQVGTNGISMHKYLNGSNFYNLYYPISVNLNEWYNIVATDSTSTGMKIYVNGIIVASVNYTGAIDLTYNDIGWGYYNGYQDRRGFTGYVDQGRIFNKTLTASEVYALYNE